MIFITICTVIGRFSNTHSHEILHLLLLNELLELLLFSVVQLIHLVL